VFALADNESVKIYTKGGDKGQTSLFTGQRVSKDDPLVNAYGTVDELNSVLGLAHALHSGAGHTAWPHAAMRMNLILDTLQAQLLELGATLAAGRPGLQPRVSDEQVTQMERWIDELHTDLEPLTSFILPRGHPAAAALHVARTVCRRAERLVVGVADSGLFDLVAVRYLNRLADLLFVLAREMNRIHGVPDEKWSSQAE
jgi:cob(I)alamin adenosyltransferase